MCKQISIQEIKSLVVLASEGLLDSDEFDNSEKLITLGYNSISLLNLLQLLERTYEFVFKPENDIMALDSVENIYHFLNSQILSNK
jgi:acyl carrier protein